ncbi:DUF7379 domain-containing protein [Cryptosporangium arvum]|uniref:DUF7379 domain-containing protein n=1 Tax=Cryptosporangium arvum TaxID=80871 RepID=UPI0012EDD97C|nr:hypothetical protein [Cryptosporangium arvum]
MPELERDHELELADGVRISSSGVSAVVGAVRRPGTVRSVLADDLSGAAAPLAPLLAAAGMRVVLGVPLDDLAVSARGFTGEAPYVEVTVPAPGPDEGQVVLEVDDVGLVRWHVDVEAVTTAAAIADGTGAPRRGAAPVRAGLGQVFRVPVQQDDRRALVGFGLRKVLHLIRFPIESAAAAAGQVVVGWWENRHRPHSLNLLTPETLADVPPPDGVATARLAELADKPFLLLVHGTFSTIRSGFAGLARPGEGPGLAELVARYEGRVLGFDHQTLHVDPSANARWFLERLPRDRPVTLDVLTHSRGGLVGRRIADPGSAGAAGVPAPHVRRLIHVGTPNDGTVLASPKRWTTLLDVFTNLLSLLPEELSTATVESVIELVKQIATGVFTGLAGLTAMDPGNPAVADANRRAIGGAVRGAGWVRAVTSDFTPADGDLRLKALNAIVDPFFGAGNDLVVPTRGVYEAGEYRIADPFVVPAPSTVAHTAFFADARVRATIGEWLPGAVTD